MRSKSPLFVAVLLLLSAPALAALHQGGPDQSELRIKAQMRPEWLMCAKGADCVVINYNCTDAISVNGKYADEATKLTYQLETDPNLLTCVNTTGVPKPRYMAGCMSSQCEATNPLE